MNTKKLTFKPKFMVKVAVLTVVLSLAFSLMGVNAPAVSAQVEATGFSFSETSYPGNASVSDRAVNSVSAIRLNGSVYSDQGTPTIVAKIWNTQGACPWGRHWSSSAECQPGSLLVSQMAISVTPTGVDGFYSFAGVSINRMYQPITEGSWVGRIEAVIPNSAPATTVVSDYAWFWIDQQAPEVPALISPVAASSVAEGNVIFDWTDVSDIVPASGWATGLQGYNFELYTDSGLTNRVAQVGSTPDSNTTVNNLTAGEYFWRVRAFDNVGNYSAWSSTATFNVTAAQLPNDNPSPVDTSTKDSDQKDDTDTSTKTKPQAKKTTGIAQAAEAVSDTVATAQETVEPQAITADEEISAEPTETGEVLGAETATVTSDAECTAQKFAWWWPLLATFLVSLIISAFAKRNQRAWIIVPIALAIFAQLGNWLWWTCNCATGSVCPYFWLINLVILVLGLILYWKRTGPYDSVTV